MKFLNTTPIDDDLTVLDLLARCYGDRTSRMISLWPHSPPHVEVVHLRNFGDLPCDRVLITEGVARRLKVDGYVIEKPEWGRRERHELLITVTGERRLYESEAKRSAPHGFNALRWIREWRDWRGEARCQSSTWECEYARRAT
jgi:hypothetical protein